MYYVLRFFKMQDKLGSREEVFRMVLATALCIHCLEKKQTAAFIPQRISACSVGQSFRAQSRAHRDNQH